MENLAEKAGLETELNSSDLRQLERRSVRRRLVQGTLIPHKPQECKEDEGQNDEKDTVEDDKCRGNKGRKKTRTTGKILSQEKVSKKQPKEKRSVNLTPKKNGVDIPSEETSPSIPDLRLEAKMTAEENSRMFAGRQIHPFFSSLRAVKKSQEATPLTDHFCPVERKDRGITCGPIHVFERTEDDIVILDWENWTVYEEPLVNGGYDLKCTCKSVFEGSVKSLTIDELPIIFHPCEAPIQNKLSLNYIEKEGVHEMTPKGPSTVAEGTVLHDDLRNGTELNFMVDLSGLSDCEAKSNIEHQNIFLQERVRSYRLDCGNQPKDCLWTYKYRPKKAAEVCGNHESVKFLSEWLHSWNERNLKPNKGFVGCHITQDNDYTYTESVSDSESMDEDILKNVLLITGPAGSGKSAAIYACAQEQGFRVSEFSASACRSGAILKQLIGEALQSHQLKWAPKNPLESWSKHVNKSPITLTNGGAVKELDNEVIELVPLSDEDSQDVVMETETACAQGVFKPLILLEDVDIIFTEDRGFISAIQEIAETGKGPIILTTNGNNPVLPDNLDRLKVCFTLPSPKDLLSHLQMICAAEGFNTPPQLLDQFIECCRADIRKIIMHLQFWYQGKRSREDKKVQRNYGSLLFDLDAFHHILPMIIPWDSPSQLSEQVEKEINMSLSMLEENSCVMEAIQKELDSKEMREDLHLHSLTNGEVKKVAMLSMNGSIDDFPEFTAQFDVNCELPDTSSTPLSFSRRSYRRKLDMVVSSDSEDELISMECSVGPVLLDTFANTEPDLECNNGFSSLFPAHHNCLSPSAKELLFPGVENLDMIQCPCSESANDIHSDDGTCNSVDKSCVPESLFVPETEVDDGAETLSGTVSWFRGTDSVNVSIENDLKKHIQLNVDGIHDRPSLELNLNVASDVLKNPCDVLAHSSHQEEEASQYEHMEAVARGYQLMDECSRVDFNRFKVLEKPTSRVQTDIVQDSWIQFRTCRADLRQYVTLEKQGTSQVVELSQQISDLMSDSDILRSYCQLHDAFEEPMTSSEALNTISWCDEQLKMASTIAQHGFSFYARVVSALGSTIGFENRVDIASEMLASSTNLMALGKLVRQDTRTRRRSSTGIELEMNQSKSDFMQESNFPMNITRCSGCSESRSRLYDIIQSAVPARSYFAMKGASFIEYLASLRKISRSEASRLSKGIDKTKRRRGRVSRHYLSTGLPMLSPEDIILLDQSKLP